MLVGGTAGNLGRNALMSNSSTILLYFESEELQADWMGILEKASGNYNIRDHYDFSLKFDS